MELRSIAGDELIRYVPRWMDQRKRAAESGLDEAVWMEIRPLNRGEMKRYQGMLRFSASGDGAGVGTNRGEVDARLFAEHVVSVHNLSVGGRAIATGADLWNANDAPPEIEDLIAELGRALGSLSVLTEGQAKN